MNADRRSLFESAMKAAQDGLLPDGRDGALVIFNKSVKTKVRNEHGHEYEKKEFIQAVQWMPMVGGILKKIRNSGELLSLSAYVVYENDEFQYTLGDEETIVHRPCLDSNRGDAKLVYAIAKTKDGGIYREIMTLKDVEKVRAVSKTGKFGPWADWWDEMAKKTVIRRLAKRLPMSSDLDDLMRRDDDLYDFSGRRNDVDAQQNRIQQRGTLSQLLQSKPDTAQIGQQMQEGFQIDHHPEQTQTPASEPDTSEQSASEPEVSSEETTLSSDEREALKQFIIGCIGASTPAEGYELNPADIVNSAKGLDAGGSLTSKRARDKAGAITRSFKSVCEGKADIEAAISYTCGVIGIDPSEVQ